MMTHPAPTAEINRSDSGQNDLTPLPGKAHSPTEGSDQTPLQSAADTVFDVLVVGAGPAGSAAAIELARAGKTVLMIDQHDFPRDKICGDGLIPDSLQALESLGVLDEVMSQAVKVEGLACHGPGGGTLKIPGNLAVLPRKKLDHILVRQAQRAGARLLTPVKFLSPATAEDGRISGANVRFQDQKLTLRARWTILATGASSPPLQAAGMCERTLPSAMALRAYVKNPAWNDRIDHLQISWHKSYAPGYGWIFPCGDDLFNVGVGLYGMHEKTLSERLRQFAGLSAGNANKLNLHELFDRFIQSNPTAAELLRHGELVSDIKGAPLRCSLEGARSGKPGLLVTGEAMGSTYALTGEGIGKAMETGILSGQAIITGRTNDASVCQTYQRALAGLQPKFAIYQRANMINRMPWLINLAIRRGNVSPSLVRRMSLVLEEKANPARLFTFRGAWKFLTE